MGIQDKRDFTHDILKHSTLGLALNQEGETIYKEHVQRTLVWARRAYYDNNQLMGRSGSISYEEMKKMVEENLTVEKVGIGDCWR